MGDDIVSHSIMTFAIVDPIREGVGEPTKEDSAGPAVRCGANRRFGTSNHSASVS